MSEMNHKRRNTDFFDRSSEEERPVGSLLWQWESEQSVRWQRRIAEIWGAFGRPASLILLTGAAFMVGMTSGTTADASSPPVNRDLRQQLAMAENTIAASENELELVRLEMSRLETVMDYSTRYEIPSDLAADIHDIALSEGVEPSLAFRLVRVESGFVERAVSPVGAIGLAQLMPNTALGMDPSLSRREIFDRKTNLRLGFRYLRYMIERYGGDLRLALLAYNRGPGTVDRVRREGGDPANGYARAVIGH